MDQSTKLNLSQNQRPGVAITSGKQASDRVANWLVFLILILAFLLVRDMLINRVEAPRTSLERDIMDYSSAIQKDPKNAVAHAGLGVAYMNAGIFSTAAEEFADSVKIAPANAVYHYDLGVALGKLGRYTEALKELSLALTAKHSSRWEAPSFESGHIYMELKNYDKAIAAFQISLRLVPSDADAHYNLGRAYELKGKRSEALSHYNKTLEYVPDYEIAVEAIKRLTEK